MNDFVRGAREVIQDLVAPELKEIKGELKAVRAELRALEQSTQAGFQALHSALETAVLRGELATSRDLADLRERVSRLEERLTHRQ
jgi:hypothetical protein